MWEQIRSNRRRSRVVVVVMGMLLIGVGMAVTAAFSQDPALMLIGGSVAFLVWLVLWMVTISNGDDIMLRMAGARQIQHEHHPVLFNIVEEMTIASQLPHKPRVYVVDDPSPNAFATGRDPKKTSVAVTTGLLRILDRDELQGVVAHELGHIKNRDVALLTTAGIMMGAIVMIAELGLRVFWYSGGGRRSRSSNEGGGGQAVIMIVAMVLLILSPFLAQLMYFALSRRREYLADASGAMFTRYPEGLASALEKLGGGRQPPLSDKSKVTAPMYIVAPLRKARGGGGSLFSTHPPLKERVRILRSMAGRADFRAYDTAYSALKGRRVVGLHTLEATAPVEARHAASLDAAAAGAAMAVDPSGAPARADMPPPLPPRTRARMASDAFLGASGYVPRVCADCGAIVKIPPSLQARVTTCPRCKGDLRAPAE